MAEAKKATAKKKAEEKPKKTVAKKAVDKPIKEAKKIAVPKKAKETKEIPASTDDKSDKKLDSEHKVEANVAKAGKRSAKSVKEAEEKQAKEERKAHVDEEKSETKLKVPQKPARSKLERRSKKFRKAAELIEKDKAYSLVEAAELATKTSPAKFDATVEMHVRLNVDPKQADQNIRDTIELPAGTGKTSRIAVFADPEDVATAKKAGADIAASDEFLQQLDKETIDFDILIATPGTMPKLGKYARLLGPKGLMPNPKSGTVTNDIPKAVASARAGRVEYRVDSTGIVHLGIGKVSFGGKRIADNASAVLASIKTNRPSGIKGGYIKSVFLTTSLGPSIAIEPAETN